MGSARKRLDFCERRGAAARRSDAAVLTTLSVERGQFIRLISAHHQLSIIAVVRARRIGAEGIARLHVEFVDRQ